MFRILAIIVVLVLVLRAFGVTDAVTARRKAADQWQTHCVEFSQREAAAVEKIFGSTSDYTVEDSKDYCEHFGQPQ
jgi:hypothetical protein